MDTKSIEIEGQRLYHYDSINTTTSKSFKIFFDIFQTAMALVAYIFSVFFYDLFTKPLWLIASTCCLFLLIYLFSVIHECAHYVPAKLWGYKAKMKVRFHPYHASCSFFSPIKYKHFRTIAIMPFITILFLMAIFYLAGVHFMFVISIGLIKLLGCHGDLRLYKLAARYNDNVYFEQVEEDGTIRIGEFRVYKRRESGSLRGGA